MAGEPKESYTIEDIKAHWDAYSNMSGVRYLKDGKWHHDFSGKVKGLIQATRAERITLQSAMSFPKFLEKYAKKT